MSKQAAFPRIRAAVLRELGLAGEGQASSATDAAITVLVIVGGATLLLFLVVAVGTWVCGGGVGPQ